VWAEAWAGREVEGSRIQRDSSLVMDVRVVAIVWGEIHPNSGISTRASETRPLVDKSIFGINGNENLVKLSVRRRGADPPRNESGRVDTIA